jgi:hypothetical protein
LIIGPVGGTVVAGRTRRGPIFPIHVAGIPIIITLALIKLTAAIRTRTPDVHRVEVDVHHVDIHVPAAGTISVPATPVAPVNLTAFPVKVLVQPRPDGETHAEAHDGLDRLRRLHIDDLRIIDRHVDDLGISRNDADDLPLHDDLLLRRVHKISRRLGLGAESLDRRHHVLRLFDESLTHRRGPFQILVHPDEHVGIARERPHTLVPRLRIDIRGAFSLHETRSQHNVRWDRGCGQDQGNERVRVESDRRQ